MKALALVGSLSCVLAATVPEMNLLPRGAHHSTAHNHGLRSRHSPTLHDSWNSHTKLHTTSKSKSNSNSKSNSKTHSNSANNQKSKHQACHGNTPTTRSQWCDYDINTDYTEEPMDTGVTREYWLELHDMIVAPDGVSRWGMAVNGSIPGPTLFADWGDTVKVHVTNSLTTSLNGTSIHFHGIRQNYTNSADGVTSITQCPLAVGQSTTYTWKALQYGSTWYHSHFGLQAWEGVFGGIIINGPATANYDEDLGVLFLNDWDHETADAMFPTAEHGAPTLDNGLINGTNVYGADGSSSQTGSRFTTRFKSGTSYRLRLVNAAIDTHFKFSIDDHTIKVIASDLVPIKPYETTVLNIGMGQRYDIIVTANQARVASNFWMRAIPQATCSENANPDNIKGIVYYGRRPSTPTTTGYTYVDSCDDETSNIVPHISKTVSPAKWTELEVATGAGNSQGLFRWLLNSTTMIVDWQKPTLQAVISDNVNYAAQEAIIELDEANKWIYFVLETTFPAAHPIHLHGHDFFVLAQGVGSYDSSVPLNTVNPPRRDTAMLPGYGYVVMAWETDNPGVWLMHCHIGWHTSEGFALQFIERKSEIAGTVSKSENDRLNKICKGWDSFQNGHGITQDDSGV